MSGLDGMTGLPPRWQIVGGHETRIFGTAADPDVVLLNGGPMRGLVCGNGYVWEQILAPLDKYLPTIAVEPLGHGRTGLSSQPHPTDLAEQSTHLIALLDGLPKRPRHLVGHDEGGMIALTIAWKRPDLVASLTLISPLCLIPVGDGIPNLALSGRLHPPMSLSGQRWVVEHQSCLTEHVRHGRFMAEAASLAAELVPDDGNATLAANRPLVASYARAKAETFSLLREAAPQAPILILIGADDRIAPFDNVYGLWSQLLPHWGEARLHAINRAGYYPFREHPTASLMALRAHLSAV